jgi:hypothetical protein
MKKLQTLIKGFVLGNKLLAEEEVTLRGSSRPSIAVMSLPKEQGGIGLVDVEAFVTALQAKVAARALHPAPALWKDMLAWAVRRAFPQQGLRVLLHPPTAGGRVPVITARPTKMEKNHSQGCRVCAGTRAHAHCQGGAPCTDDGCSGATGGAGGEPISG